MNGDYANVLRISNFGAVSIYVYALWLSHYASSI
jgi:hypothetical protein